MDKIEQIKEEINREMGVLWGKLPDASSPDTSWTLEQCVSLGEYKALERILIIIENDDNEIEFPKGVTHIKEWFKPPYKK